jgi:MFS family permease
MTSTDQVSPAAPVPVPREGAFSVLRLNPAFRSLWLSAVASALGQWMQSTALGWLALDISNRSSFVGLVAFASGIPFLFVSIPGGLLLDRFDRRNVLIVCQAIAAVCAVLLAVDVITGAVRAWHLLVFAFLNGSLQAIVSPAQQTIVPSLVSRERLTNGIALMSMAQNMTRVVGPSIAGAIIGVAGTGAAFLCQSIALVFALLVLLTTRFPDMAIRRAGASLDAVFDGARLTWRRRDLRAIIALISITILLVFPYISFLSVFARDVLDIGPEGLGILMAASGVGAVLGSIYVALRKQQPSGRGFVAMGIVYGVIVAAFAVSPTVPIAVFFLVVAGFLGSAYFSLVNSALQHSISDEVRGRVMSIYMLTWGFMPIGSIVIGAVASSIGMAAAVAGAALLSSALLLALYLFDPHVREI